MEQPLALTCTAIPSQDYVGSVILGMDYRHIPISSPSVLDVIATTTSSTLQQHLCHTLFYFLVIIFRISATFGDLNGYVFFSQVISTPLYMRLFVSANQANYYEYNKTYLRVVYSFYGIWNLDFFRLLYKPYCIDRHISAQGIISLDYIVAFYPLILIVCTYFFVVLHERDCKLIFFLWKPFHRYFARFRSQWNIKRSLIHAFSTFLLLSYVKILNVSFDLLRPTIAIRSPYAKVRAYFYFDPSIFMFDSHHSFFFALAVFVTLLCVIVPLILMLSYPCRCFHRIVNINHPEFYIFMDTFTGCYRQKPSYCKSFAGIYFILRIVILIVFEVTPTLIYIPTISAVVMLAAILFVLARPYKKLSHNLTDAIFLIHLAMCYNLQGEVLTTKVYDSKHFYFVYLFSFALALPLLYPTFLVLRFSYHSSVVQRVLHEFCYHWSVVRKIRETCMHRESQELLDSVRVSEPRYGSIPTVEAQ